MLFNAASSPYDLRFPLFGFPIRITPVFWIASLLLGGDRPPVYAATWVLTVLVSVIVHELGHAFLQRAFGGQAQIVLYAFGGYASAVGVRETWQRNVLIALAGPAAGFGLWALVRSLVMTVGVPASPVGAQMVGDLLWVNLYWSLFNLAPIWPLDGGRVARELMTLLMKPTTGIVASLGLSMACAAAIAAYLYQATGSLWNTALFGLLAYQSYETMQQYRASRGGW